jgi:phage anti-repressor protein
MLTSEDRFPIALADAAAHLELTQPVSKTKNDLVNVYRLVEGSDFSNASGDKANPIWYISVDCFKSMCMRSRSAGGREYRAYIVYVESVWRKSLLERQKSDAAEKNRLRSALGEIQGATGSALAGFSADRDSARAFSADITARLEAVYDERDAERAKVLELESVIKAGQRALGQTGSFVSQPNRFVALLSRDDITGDSSRLTVVDDPALHGVLSAMMDAAIERGRVLLGACRTKSGIGSEKASHILRDVFGRLEDKKARRRARDVVLLGPSPNAVTLRTALYRSIKHVFELESSLDLTLRQMFCVVKCLNAHAVATLPAEEARAFSLCDSRDLAAVIERADANDPNSILHFLVRALGEPRPLLRQVPEAPLLLATDKGILTLARTLALAHEAAAEETGDGRLEDEDEDEEVTDGIPVLAPSRKRAGSPDTRGTKRSRVVIAAGDDGEGVDGGLSDGELYA